MTTCANTLLLAQSDDFYQCPPDLCPVIYTAAAEAAETERRVYPHCLRATAASYHAYQGVVPVPLQALMGWSDLATAQKFIPISWRATADALR